MDGLPDELIREIVSFLCLKKEPRYFPFGDGEQTWMVWSAPPEGQRRVLRRWASLENPMDVPVSFVCEEPGHPQLPESVEVTRVEARALEMELNRDGSRVTDQWAAMKDVLYEVSNGTRTAPTTVGVEPFAWLADAMSEPKRSARRIAHSVVTLGGDLAAAGSSLASALGSGAWPSPTEGRR